MSEFVPKNRWPSTPRARLFLMFAIRLKELLHPAAQDIYRVHAVSSLAKIEELDRCCGDVMNGRYPKPTLKPIIAEVNECIESDIVIKRIIRKEKLPVTYAKFDEVKSTEALQGLAKLWKQLLADKYEKELKSEIISTLRTEKLKKKLLICAKLFGSHLLYRGFKREFVLELVEQHFFRKDIGQCTDSRMSRFLDAFDSAERKYHIVLFGGEEATSVFGNGGKIDVLKSTDSLKKLLGFMPAVEGELDTDRHAIVIRDVGESNPYGALDRVSLILSFPNSFGVVYPSPVTIALEDQCLVVDAKDRKTLKISRSALAAPAHSYTSQIPYNRDMFGAFAKYVWAVTRNDDINSFGRLNRSLDAAHSALRTENAATQLVSLWSAFEALLPPPSKDQKTIRINHFVDFIVPCIARKYIKGKYRIFLDDVQRHSLGDVSPLLGGDLGRTERPKRLAEILLTDQAATKALFSEISDSPIALQRLFELGKLMTDPSRVKSKQLSHENRVSWQVHRIYRERNMIVHSGKSSEYLPVLVENLFLYYRLVMRALQQMHSRYNIYSPDSALELVSALHLQKRERLDMVLSNTNDREFHSNFLSAIFDD